MKKTIIRALLMICVIFNFSFLLVSCGDNNGEHICNFDKKVATKKYIANDKTCTSPASYFYSCDCGKIGTEIFNYGQNGEHKFEEFVLENNLKEEPNCKHGSMYYKSCECGFVSTQTFEYGLRKNHKFENGTCINNDCGFSLFVFELSLDDSYYICKGLSENLFEDEVGDKLEIPSHYNGKNVCEISENAFNNLTFKIEEITLPDTIISIGDYAFYKLNIEKINLSKNLTYIGSYAFANCVNITELELPSMINELGSYSFMGTGVKEINLPLNLQVIREGVFKSCKNLKSLVFPESLKILEGYVLMDCENLEEVSLHSTLTMIPENMFANCYNLKTIRVNNSKESNILPTMVVEIEHNAFYNCINLISITIPESVNFIDTGAFFCLLDGGITEIIFKNVENWYSITYGYTEMKSNELMANSIEIAKLIKQGISSWKVLE